MPGTSFKTVEYSLDLRAVLRQNTNITGQNEKTNQFSTDSHEQVFLPISIKLTQKDAANATAMEIAGWGKVWTTDPAIR